MWFKVFTRLDGHNAYLIQFLAQVSMVSLGSGAVYFTSDTGLHRIDDYSISNVSEGFLSNKQWRDLTRQR